MAILEILFQFITRVFSRKLLFKIGKRIINVATGDNNDDMKSNGEQQVLKTILASHSAHEFTFFDVGANVGLWTLNLLSFHEIKPLQKITGHCFEPSRFTFKKLKDALNVIPNASGIVIHNMAVSNDSTPLRLFINKEGAGTNSVYERQGFVNISQESVAATTIDLFCEQNQIPHIDFLKIDVEGHEIKVLQGAKKMLQNKKIDFIQFEYGGCWIDSRTFLLEVFHYLFNFGYQIGKILPRGLEQYSLYNPCLDTFQMANFLAYLPESEKIFYKYSPTWAK